MNLALAVARSGNEKVGDCAVTYAAQQSCPASCPFKDGGGCYAENGRLYTSTTGPLNGAADGYSDIDVALAEADAIDGVEIISNRPMRLHTVGDCASDDAALIVSAAAARYRDAGGGPVWTYTHAWRDVDRASWGDVSVLASCEDAAAVHAAREAGYAPSVVVDGFPTHRRYQLDPAQGRPVRIAESHADAPGTKAGTGGVEVLPCPAQTRHDVTCASCRLCMNDEAILARGYAIGFAVHGTALVVKKALATLDDPTDDRRRLTSRDHALEYRREHGDWPRVSVLSRIAGVNESSASQMLQRLRAAA